MAKKKRTKQPMSGVALREGAQPASTAKKQPSPLPQQPQQRRRYVQRRRWSSNPLLLIGSALAIILLIVGIFIYISLNQKMVATIGPTDTNVLKKVTSVQSQVFTDVGTANVQNILKTTKATGPLKGPTGKPEFFYYGAEFCPLCAAERWPVVVSLSRFGTFTKLPQTASSSTDTNPNTATFTFVNNKYISKYIDFVPVEAEDRDGKALQKVSLAQQQLLQQYKVTGFPFIDIADGFTVSSPQFNPDVLTGLSQKDIASKLNDSGSDVTQNIIGSANYLTAAICAVTENKPAEVCTSDPIPSVQKTLLSVQPSAISPDQSPAGVSAVAVVQGNRREDNTF